MPRRADDYRGLTQMSRLKLLRAVQSKPGQFLQELATEADIHLNTAREHLRILEDQGFITSEPVHTGERGRPPVVYHPVAKPTDNPAAQRRLEAAQERGELLRRIAPNPDHNADLDDAAVRQLDILYEHLDDSGFEPDIDESELKVNLVPCPHHAVVEQDQALVCAVHARLVNDLLRQVPGPLELGRLYPFVTPHECHLALSMDQNRQLEEEQSSSDKEDLVAEPGVSEQ